MRVILINPFEKTVTLQEIEGSLNSYYKILGVSAIEAYTWDETGAYSLVFDEEGGFKDYDSGFGFNPGTGTLNIYGKAVLVKNSDDDWVDCDLTLDEVMDRIRFFRVIRRDVNELRNKENRRFRK